MSTRKRSNNVRKPRIKRSSDVAHVFYSTYYDDPENRFSGYVLCVTTDSNISEKSTSHPDRWIKYHHLQSEPIYTSLHTANSDGESRKVIWLVLMGLLWPIEEDWESFEPTCVGAAWDIATAKRLQNDVDQGGNTVVMGFPDGWLYGRDKIPPVA